MSAPQSCNPCCSTTTATQIPGPAGVDATVLPPIVGSPEGSLVGTPGQTVLNTTDDSYWIKKTGTGNTGWLKLLGLWMALFCSASLFADQPSYQRNPLTTNDTPTSLTLVSNVATARIAVDATHQATNSVLTALAAGNGSALSSNVSPSAISSPTFTGIITNKSTLSTNTEYYSGGVLTNATRVP
jgi:hypothetical protein